MRLRLAATVAAALIALSPCFAADAPALTPAALKVVADIDARRGDIADLASKIWGYAELGYKEEKSSRLLADALEAEGFRLERGVAGIPTAFTAEFGSGAPVIGVLAEFDALPGINQDASATRAEIAGKNAGHACGHNLFGAGSVGAAIAIKDWLAETKTPGTIRLYGTPAEEGGSGKVYLVREGLFKDVDIVLHWHADEKNSAEAETSLANRSAKFRFKGLSAHAAGAPERGRSALDGVEALNMMVNMMREHVPQDARIHYVITKGGSAPNVVPDAAEVFYYVRHPKPQGVEEIWARLEDAARGAALGTGTSVDWEIIHGSYPLLINEHLAKMMNDKLIAVGGVEYTKDEAVFAKKIYATLGATDRTLDDAMKIEPYKTALSYGSTDVGDVSWAAPTVGLNTATWVPGTPAHSWQAVAASGMSIGHKGATNAAKILSLAAIELFQNPELRSEARAEFEEKRKGVKYKPLLGDRKPALDYRD